MADLQKLQLMLEDADKAAQNGDAQAHEDVGVLLGEIKKAQQTPASEEPAKISPYVSVQNTLGTAAGNVYPSAKNMASGIYDAVTSPVQTATTMWDVYQGGKANLSQYTRDKLGLSRIEPDADTRRQMDTADAVGQHYKDRYGGWDKIRNTFETDPVGFAADASTVLTGVGGVTRGVGSALPGAVGRGTVAAGSKIGAVGNAIDPINAAAKVAKGVGNTVKGSLALSTGTSTADLAEALDSGIRGTRSGGQVFRDHMRGAAPADDIVPMAKTAVKNMDNANTATYKQGMAGVGQNKTVLDFTDIDKAIAEARSVVVSPNTGRVINTDGFKILEQIEKEVAWYKALPDSQKTATVLDELKKSLGHIEEGTVSAVGRPTPSSRVATGIRKSVGDTIAKQDPLYAKTMQDFGGARQGIDELVAALSLRNKGSTDTAMRKLSSALRDNVNTNFGKRRELVDILSENGAPDLVPAIAGQNFSSATPRGLARLSPAILTAGGGATAAGLGVSGLGVPAAVGAAVTAAASSPRLVGEAVHAAGRAVSPLAKLNRAVPKSVRNNILLGLYRSDELADALENRKK